MRIKDPINLDQMKGEVYVMSDLHIGHENVLRFDSRPFETVEEMNSSIIGELEKLRSNDILIDLGDMFWNLTEDECIDILKKIKVHKFYKAVGNHDKDLYYYGKDGRLGSFFTQMSDILDLRIKWEGHTYRLALSHYPLLEWNHKNHGSVMVHGHSHGSLDVYDRSSTDLRVDIGYNSLLARETGSFLVPIKRVIEYFRQRTGGMAFGDWAQSHIMLL